MARYLVTAESATAINATAPTGATANQLFAAIPVSATYNYKLRRVTLGVRAGTGAPTSQQLTVAMVRFTARGTATTTNAPVGLDQPAATASFPGCDVAWSTVPTATWTAPYFYEVSFNSQSGVDLPFELLEEILVPATASNAKGIAFINVGNALPTAHLLTLSGEVEE